MKGERCIRLRQIKKSRKILMIEAYEESFLERIYKMRIKATGDCRNLPTCVSYLFKLLVLFY